MKVISCASYYGTGSSAITDYVSEFDGVFSMTNEEFRFIQDPDGIDDLEFHLVENHNRHNADTPLSATRGSLISIMAIFSVASTPPTSITNGKKSHIDISIL